MEVQKVCIENGVRLRDIGPEGAFTWADLWAIVSTLPPGHRLSNLLNEEDAQINWSHTNMLLASAVDALNVLIWQKTSDGQKGKKHPKPIPRPGVQMKGQNDVKKHKGHAVSLDEAQEIFRR